MAKPKLRAIINTTKHFTKEHGPKMFTGIGIAGMYVAIGMAVKATPKALELIEEEKEILEVDELTPIETVKAAWKPYIPAAITAGVSTACLIGACSESTKRTAALATAYKLSESAFAEYKDKVVETIGEKKEKTVREKVAQEHVINNLDENDVIYTGYGNTLCFDPLSGRLFRSNIDRINKAENEINNRLLHDICGYASINEFYNELGLPHTEITGDILGWNTDNLVKIDIGSFVTEKGEPCIVVGHINEPRYEYYK